MNNSFLIKQKKHRFFTKNINGSVGLFFVGILLFVLSACNGKANNNESPPKKPDKSNHLSFLSGLDTLMFRFTDDKCGEWGGDTKSIDVYKAGSNYPEYDVLVDLNEFEMNCDSVGPDAKHKKVFTRHKIQIDDEHQELIIEAMDEYFMMKLNSNADIPAMFGCFSGISTTDKKMYMTLYPSPQWEKFDLLFEKLKNSGE